MKKFFDEFKKFITRGNIIDLAVGIVVGAAFTSIVNSLVNDILMPPIGLLFGSKHFSELKIVLKAATETTAEVAINWGIFLSKIIDFVIIAFSIFLLVKVINAIRDHLEKGSEFVKAQLAKLNDDKDEKELNKCDKLDNSVQNQQPVVEQNDQPPKEKT